MKDYSLNSKDSKSFILNYEIKDKQIIINFASGDKYKVPFTKKNEKKILKKMRKQVKLSDEFYSEQEKKMDVKLLCFQLFCPALIVATVYAPSIIFIYRDSVFMVTLQILIMTMSTISIATLLYSIIQNNKNLKDADKNKLFLKKEKLINEKLKENENILSNTNDYTKELINSSQKKLNLNDIDKMSYSELKIILDNIKNEEKFNFVYPKQEEKKYVKTKY